MIDKKSMKAAVKTAVKASDPIKQGYRAFKAGRTEDSNPYRTGSISHGKWNAGWIEGLTEWGMR